LIISLFSLSFKYGSLLLSPLLVLRFFSRRQFPEFCCSLFILLNFFCSSGFFSPGSFHSLFLGASFLFLVPCYLLPPGSNDFLRVFLWGNPLLHVLNVQVFFSVPNPLPLLVLFLISCVGCLGPSAERSALAFLGPFFPPPCHPLQPHDRFIV